MTTVIDKADRPVVYQLADDEPLHDSVPATEIIGKIEEQSR